MLQLTGFVLIVALVAFNASFLALGRLFDYPSILRRPTPEVLSRFRDSGRPLRIAWYAFALSGLLFSAVPLLLHPSLEERGVGAAMLTTGTGLAAGLVQVSALLRWSFLVPFLAERYAPPAIGDQDRRAIELLFEGAHRYVGMGLGEHLGYLLTGTWTILMALVLPHAGLVVAPLGWVGIAPGLAILAGLLEPAGVESAGVVNALGYLALSVWLIVVGIVFLVG
jgi:hypothetical protein